MAKTKVIIDFPFFKLNYKVGFGDVVIKQMTDNAAIFPTPKIPLATLAATNNNLRDKIVKSASGNKVDLEELDAVLPIWEEQFRQQASYVNEVANGDKVIITNSGFHFSKSEKHKPDTLDKPFLKAAGGKNQGQLDLETQPLKTAKAFLFLAATKGIKEMHVSGNRIEIQLGEEKIVLVLSSKRKATMSAQTRASMMDVACIALNSAGLSPTSNSVNVVVP